MASQESSSTSAALVVAAQTPNDPTDTSARELIGGSERDRALRILQHGHYSDLIINCQGHTFRVHKFILITKGGDFFERAICGGFSETDKSKIDLPEDDPGVIARALHYIYTGGYESFDHTQGPQLSLTDLSSSQDQENELSISQADNLNWIASKFAPEVHRLLIHVHMFAIACKLGNPALKEHARKAFLIGVTLVMKRTHCLEFFPHIEIIFSTVYETTSAHERDLRNVCLQEAMVELHVCKTTDQMCKKSRLRKMIEGLPDLAVDVSTHYLRQRGLGIMSECRDCKRQNWWFGGICACGYWHKYCDEPDCVAAAEALTQCTRCGAKGTGRIDMKSKLG
ncbi:uncharacterized protein AB675_587 [Cyphellophora attinorum]|uniref:BTB domain-containing protein n=1 Tax=Cyphellophora attinorum TaxID=1664694 RepID=A0A0N1P2J1_9EURO|nr:uncharacterized protein AB675_587 [Phialophora attinorum]KPI45957.1 hypothetical protein AB675_587 [Phialophora attinorum]